MGILCVSTHTDGSRGVGVFNLRLFVCLSALSHDISKTKLDIEMFIDESWKPIYFRVKKSKVKVRVTKTLPTWVFALL